MVLPLMLESLRICSTVVLLFLAITVKLSPGRTLYTIIVGFLGFFPVFFPLPLFLPPDVFLPVPVDTVVTPSSG